ncbi:vomeronasal 1 receptor 234 [Mus musculus]|uniref:Vomeronasal type-1 receptor n=3 Tax=Mus musculus TaxID=10090 RepID=Q8R298_MOUSE|nr:vomeronasal 1 receptor 234 [Mus musculus]AEF00379.1 vomeronasal type 1 receptor F1 [Mus musculus domesticus]AEF00393.1 vomeronasal type 1 receptor F1 [Mus musculus musculus]AAI27027.1 Vomeronasal 1 receptor, F1 [Mus musculus]AAL47917.1 vomeronasal receptor V1RF1 [Mus musculus]AEF00380.1 vomeronasal type 1 receptor F1 [Mus musculus domesticus]|eukprot:NP_598959.1 vomeronasal 1 receptor 234 [Mus musculus]
MKQVVHAYLLMQNPRDQAEGSHQITSGDMAIGVILVSQTVAGVLGNSCLLYNYIVLYFKSYKLKHMDWILMHLIVSNFLTLLCKGVPQAMAAFGFQCFFNDFECKLLSYLHRVGRGVSFGSACLLSVFQVITISPEDAIWTILKKKAPKCISSSLYLTWILSLLFSIVSLKYMSAKLCNVNNTNLKDLGYCSSLSFDKTAEVLHAAHVIIPGAVCMFFMLCSSGSMVLILHRHRQRMEHMIRSNIFPRSSHESRATQTILLLVSTFVCFYTLSTLLTICLNFLVNLTWHLVSIHAIFSMCFASVSPYLLMRHGSSTSIHCFAWVNYQKS